MNAGYIILTLKVAVVAVTLLLGVSLFALVRGNVRLHGRLNVAFFVLTLTALIGLEYVVKVYDKELIATYLAAHDASGALQTHLNFAVPSALLLLVMLPTGWRNYRNVHLALGVVFLMLWAGTFFTGVFTLPHEMP